MPFIQKYLPHLMIALIGFTYLTASYYISMMFSPGLQRATDGGGMGGKAWTFWFWLALFVVFCTAFSRLPFWRKPAPVITEVLILVPVTLIFGFLVLNQRI